MIILTQKHSEDFGFLCMYAISVINLLFIVGSWIITKLVPRNSRLDETLHFLLDHPRRCFVYLFPSYQTWFLLTILAIMKYAHLMTIFTITF